MKLLRDENGSMHRGREKGTTTCVHGLPRESAPIHNLRTAELKYSPHSTIIAFLSPRVGTVLNGVLNRPPPPF